MDINPGGMRSTQETGGASMDYETVFTNAKAGMSQVDREHVKKVVYEMSKGSDFYANERAKEEKWKERVAQMQAVASKVSHAELLGAEKVSDHLIAELESKRDLSRTWLHVDMDAFYAAVEERDHPELRGKPVAVGGMSMISTANYEARKFGVRSAMPGFIARKLCPALIFVPHHFDKYIKTSEATRAVFAEYDPGFLPMSLDEAYLDVTAYCAQHGKSGAEVAQELRAKVATVSGGLTCSAGIAANRMLAKLCSEINKPNGQFQLPSERDAIVRFMSTLPVRKVGGIGKVSEATLHAFGVKVCGDLLPKRGLLRAVFSQISADFFLRVALGIGSSEPPSSAAAHSPGSGPPGAANVGRKSVSVERTFEGTGDEQLLASKIRELADSLARHLAEEQLQGLTLTLKLKTVKFQVKSRAVSLPHPCCEAKEILPPALKLLRSELPIRVRLMGLRMHNLRSTVAGPSSQPTLDSFLPKPATALPSRGEDDGKVAEERQSGEGSAAPAMPRTSAGGCEGHGGQLVVWAGCDGDDDGHLVEQAGRDGPLDDGHLASAHMTEGGDPVEADMMAAEFPLGEDEAKQAGGLGLGQPELGLNADDIPADADDDVAGHRDACVGGRAEWPCPLCTFLNPWADARCGMCGEGSREGVSRWADGGLEGMMWPPGHSGEDEVADGIEAGTRRSGIDPTPESGAPVATVNEQGRGPALKRPSSGGPLGRGGGKAKRGYSKSSMGGTAMKRVRGKAPVRSNLLRFFAPVDRMNEGPCAASSRDVDCGGWGHGAGSGRCEGETGALHRVELHPGNVCAEEDKAVGPARVVCVLCGVHVVQADKQLHDDHHVALELQKKFDQGDPG